MVNRERTNNQTVIDKALHIKQIEQYYPTNYYGGVLDTTLCGKVCQ